MQTEIIFGSADPSQDIPLGWEARKETTNEAPIADDSNEGSSTIVLRETPHVKQADAVDVRETSVRAVACEKEDAELRSLYKIPEGGEISPIQRLFAGLARDLQAITQQSVDRKFNLNAGVSVSRSKSANARSKMLKMIMPELSRETGDKLAEAVGNNDGDAVAAIMTQIGKKLQKRLNMKNRK
ncbi:hypothetical protein JA13_201 [Dickeya phage vB_DsoM_JA13]|uniref:Uncharacterized protein n=1 Tax=Dickeya phage vB_DsoM_JA13 TaxID=2283030 RepID=A0A384ZWJ5_9CAUD|nr:hypothetical protein JA13_201 [Dickeya phage vB_DsoM_JA13]